MNVYCIFLMKLEIFLLSILLLFFVVEKYFDDNDKQHSSLKYLHLEYQCLSTSSGAYLLDEAVIASALPRMMATNIC